MCKLHKNLKYYRVFAATAGGEMLFGTVLVWPTVGLGPILEGDECLFDVKLEIIIWS